MVTFNRHASRDAARQGRLVLALIAGVLALLSTLVGTAQDSSGSDWESGPAESRCSPRCRSGYECKHSECLPICSPACGAGYLCTAGGSCVRTDGPPPPVSSSQSWGSSSNQCLPSCRTGYTCVSGQCVSLCNPVCPVGEMCTENGECVVGNAEPMAVPVAAAAGQGAAQQSQPAPPPAPPPRSPSADSVVNLHMDALGLLQFGLTATVEAGKKVSGYLRVRALNTGLMSYFLLAPDDGDRFNWGIGAALGMHIFSAGQGNMRGVFGGPALEYVFVETENDAPYRVTYGTHVLLPQMDLGYRWAFNSFLLAVGGRLGVSVPVASWDQPCPTGDLLSCEGDRRIYPFGGIFVDVGLFL